MTNQCTSWNQKTNKRCTKEVYKSSKHCEDHYKKAQELYLKYKNFCEAAYALDIDKISRKKKISHLRRCHNLLIKAYNARLEHRNYAFAPECHDFGHDLQFQIIQDKIDKCNAELLNLRKTLPLASTYDEDEKNDDADEENGKNDKHNIKESKNDKHNIKESKNEIKESKESKNKIEESKESKENKNEAKESKESKESKNEIKETKEILSEDKLTSDYKQAIKEMKEFTAKRKRDERETEKLIAKYISENKTYLDDKSRIVNAVVSEVKSLCKTDDFNINLSIYKLIRGLCLSNYFERESKIRRSNDGTCKSIISVTLAPSTKPQFPSLPAVFDHMYISEVIDFAMFIASNLENIKSIIGDILDLFKKYGDSALMMPLELLWNARLRRLVLSKASINPVRNKKSHTSPELKKEKSRESVINRLRDKVYLKR